jgi:hypothetical protein
VAAITASWFMRGAALKCAVQAAKDRMMAQKHVSARAARLDGRATFAWTGVAAFVRAREP